MAFPFSILDRILKLNIGISQSENREMFELLGSVRPLKLHAFRSGQEHNGWVIPHDWQVHRATIEKDGKALFDGMAHPLAVAAHSGSFHGVLAKTELDRHILSKKEFPDSYGFFSSFTYRPWLDEWAFCVPASLHGSWGGGEYQVDLRTEKKPGEMLVAESVVSGISPESILFAAHTCHPCQANDDMAGVILVLELLNRLEGRTLRYSYMGVLGPEHIGTVYYVRDLDPERLRRIRLGCFVEMPGTRTLLTLQRSLRGSTLIDRVAEHVLTEIQPDLRVGDYSTVVGNDESVWESPGVEVPMVSVSRWPYPEYHCSLDNAALMSAEHLEETLTALERMVDVIETDCTVMRRFTGLIALSNPRYDLYFEHPDPVQEKQLSDLQLRFARLQDSLQRFFNGRISLFEIAERYGIPFRLLRDYVKRFEEKGLVTLSPVESLDWYSDTTERWSKI